MDYESLKRDYLEWNEDWRFYVSICVVPFCGRRYIGVKKDAQKNIFFQFTCLCGENINCVFFQKKSFKKYLEKGWYYFSFFFDVSFCYDLKKVLPCQKNQFMYFFLY